MKLIDIRKIERAELPNEDFKELFDKLKEDTENFNDDLLELYEDEVNEFLKVVKKYKPEAIKTQPVRKAPKEAPSQPVIEFDAPDVVQQVMEDYNLTQDKAERLIALRKEAVELKKQNLEKLLEGLGKSEFYTGKLSKASIDKNRTRDLGKDSKQGSITSAEERKMTGTPFKRISKAGRKNQFGTTEGGKVYYEYRMNRRDVDNKIKLAKGGGVLSRYTIIFENAKGEKEYMNTDAYNKAEAMKIGKFLEKDADYQFYRGNFKAVKVVEAIFSKGYQLEDPKKLYSLLNEAEANWSKDGGAEYNRIVDLIKENRKNYYKLLNEAEANWSKDGGAEYNRLIKLQKHFFKTGGDIPNADKMFHLPYELAVYVPSTKDVDKSITTAELRARVKEVEKYLAETFGGFTSAEKVGGYLSSKSSVVTEKVVPVTAFSSLQDFRANKSKLINKMSVWAKKWGQEAIGFEFEGDLYYVPQKFKTGGKVKATYIPQSDIKSLTTIWGSNIRGKDLLDGAYTTRKNIKKAPQVTRYFADDEAYEYKTGGGLQNTHLNFGYDKRVKGKRIASSGNQIELRQNTQTGKYCVFDDMYPIKETETEYKTQADQEYLYAVGMAEFKSGARKTMPQKPKMVRSIIEEEEYEYFAKGGAIEHGLKVGDEILEIGNNLVIVLPKGESKESTFLNYDIINISNGSRMNGIDYYSMTPAQQRKWAK